MFWHHIGAWCLQPSFLIPMSLSDNIIIQKIHTRTKWQCTFFGICLLLWNNSGEEGGKSLLFGNTHICWLKCVGVFTVRLQEIVSGVMRSSSCLRSALHFYSWSVFMCTNKLLTSVNFSLLCNHRQLYLPLLMLFPYKHWKSSLWVKISPELRNLYNTPLRMFFIEVHAL